jgi:2-keto-4-pentenoate hydratase
VRLPQPHLVAPAGIGAAAHRKDNAEDGRGACQASRKGMPKATMMGEARASARASVGGKMADGMRFQGFEAMGRVKSGMESRRRIGVLWAQRREQNHSCRERCVRGVRW